MYAIGIQNVMLFQFSWNELPSENYLITTLHHLLNFFSYLAHWPMPQTHLLYIIKSHFQSKQAQSSLNFRRRAAYEMPLVQNVAKGYFCKKALWWWRWYSKGGWTLHSYFWIYSLIRTESKNVTRQKISVGPTLKPWSSPLNLPTTILKIVSYLVLSHTATWAGHWLLGRPKEL